MILAQEKKVPCGLPEEYSAPAPGRRLKRLPSGHKLALTGLVIAGFLLGALTIFYYAQVNALGQQINRLEKELARLRVENDGLDADVHKLASLDRVEQIALNKLNMVKPDSQNVLLVTIDTPVAGVPAAPAGQAVHLADKEQEGQKNPLIQAFTDLVNQLGERARLGRSREDMFLEGFHADHDKHLNAQKNNRALACGLSVFDPFNIPPGLAAAG